MEKTIQRIKGMLKNCELKEGQKKTLEESMFLLSTYQMQLKSPKHVAEMQRMTFSKELDEILDGVTDQVNKSNEYMDKLEGTCRSQ